MLDPLLYSLFFVLYSKHVLLFYCCVMQKVGQLKLECFFLGTVPCIYLEILLEASRGMKITPTNSLEAIFLFPSWLYSPS